MDEKGLKLVVQRICVPIIIAVSDLGISCQSGGVIDVNSC